VPPPGTISNDKDEWMEQSACSSGFPLSPMMATQDSLGMHALAISLPGIHHLNDAHGDWRSSDPDVPQAPASCSWPATNSDGTASATDPILPIGTCWRLKLTPEEMASEIGFATTVTANGVTYPSNEYQFYKALREYGAYDVMGSPGFHVGAVMQPERWTRSGNQLKLTKDPDTNAVPEFFEYMEPVAIPYKQDPTDAPDLDPLTFGAWDVTKCPDHAALRAAM
jgi:hypothetical protein